MAAGNSAWDVGGSEPATHDVGPSSTVIRGGAAAEDFDVSF
jgi:hypothetical protein